MVLGKLDMQQGNIISCKCIAQQYMYVYVYLCSEVIKGCCYTTLVVLSCVALHTCIQFTWFKDPEPEGQLECAQTYVCLLISKSLYHPVLPQSVWTPVPAAQQEP